MDAQQALTETLAAYSIGGTVGDSTGNEVPLTTAIIETLAAYGFQIVAKS